MITVRSSDEEEFEIEGNVAKESHTMKHMIEDACAKIVISLPSVNSKILSKVIEDSKKHVDSSSKSDEKTADEELKAWDAEFVKVDQATLLEESRNMKKEESEDSKTEKTKGMKKANTEDTKKEEAKDMKREETDNVQDVEMEDIEAEDSKMLEDKDVIKEQDNKDVEGKEKESLKPFVIEKGCGTPLKDIPNVAYKIGKKKPAELKLLHQTLFGRVGKESFKSKDTPKTKEKSAHEEEEDDENGVPAEDDEPENSEGKEKEFESEEEAEDDTEKDPEEKSSGMPCDSLRC